MRTEKFKKELKKNIAEYKAKKQSNNKIEASAKDIDNELRAKEDKYLSSYKPSEKQAKDIKTLHDKLKTQAEKEGYDTNKTNWRDDLQSNNKIDDDTYKFKESYKSYHEKMQSHGDREKWSAKEYTNDEFMEHLTDSNWHKERSMIEEAKLTNKQLTELKNQIIVSKWGVENFDYNNAKEMIDKVKKDNKQETIKKYVEKKQSNKGKYTVDYWKSKGVDIKDKAPNGYIRLEGATTAPNGYEWYSNGKSRFSNKEPIQKNNR